MSSWGAKTALFIATVGLLAGARLVAAAPPEPQGAPGPAASAAQSAQRPAASAPPEPQGAPSPAASAPPEPQSAQSPAASASATPEKTWSSCVDYLPEGAIRPNLEVRFPPNGTSGYELRLLVTVTHGRGETVLPAGFRIDRGSDAMRAIEAAHFHVPETTGGSQPIIDRPKDAEVENGAKKLLTTTLSLPFIALPDKPGRQILRLPPLPVAVGRANGQVMTVCTPGMAVTIEDPIANESQPAVRPNDPPRSQLEEWVLAKQVAWVIAAAIVLAALGAWLATRWDRRPKVLPPAPRIPPWVTALEELAAIRHSRLLEDEQLDEFADRVNNCVRRYLGDRFGFDGLESTTSEIRGLLKRIDPTFVDRNAVEGFLDDTDLVKFAKFTPGFEDCALILARADTIVRSTIPTRSKRSEGPT